MDKMLSKKELLKHIKKRMKELEKIYGIGRNDDPEVSILELAHLYEQIEKM
jgi:hypothetical protein